MRTLKLKRWFDDTGLMGYIKDMSNSGLGGMKPGSLSGVGESLKSRGTSKGSASTSSPPDLSSVLEGLLSGKSGGSATPDMGIEKISKGKGDDKQQKLQAGTAKGLDPEEMMKRRQKEAELEARLREIIARYQRIQEAIQAYRKQKKQEEEQKKIEEEQEKERKRKEKEVKKQQSVALPSSPKKGFMAGFLKKLSGGSELGRLKE